MATAILVTRYLGARVSCLAVMFVGFYLFGGLHQLGRLRDFFFSCIAGQQVDILSLDDTERNTAELLGWPVC